MPVTETARALFVAWQQPTTRRFFPVGRLIAGAPQGPRYEFAYIQGARDAKEHGFEPFLAFPVLEEVCRSDVLFPFFANRVMQRSRPDFPAYAQRLGLDPKQADDIDILIRSGGVRATDSTEVFQLPTFDEVEGCFRTHFMVHGIRHLPAEAQARILQLQPDEELILRPEPTNAFDPHAVQLFTSDGVQVGYMPRYLAEDTCRIVRECDYVHVRVEQVNRPPAPHQQLLLCELRSCWPEGFEPCSSPVYQPISSKAISIKICG